MIVVFDDHTRFFDKKLLDFRPGMADDPAQLQIIVIILKFCKLSSYTFMISNNNDIK